MQPAPYNIDKAKFSLLANSWWVQAARVGDVQCGAIPLHQREHSPGEERGEGHYFQVIGRGGIISFYLVYSSADPVHQRLEPGERKMHPPQISLWWKVFLYVDDLGSSEAEAEGIGPLSMIRRQL